MPIYEYRCVQCGHTFDAFQRVGADGKNLVCPVCNTPKPEKLFSAFASSGSSSVTASGSSGCGGGGGFS
jgi:putative FmdB family regulatory protein